MKRALVLVFVAGLAATFAAAAQDQAPVAEANGIEIADGYATSSSPAAQTGAAYMRITNTAAAADRLIAVEGDAARRIELHMHSIDDGVARMREVEGGVALPPGATVTFESGGLNVMLMGLTGPLTEGEAVELTLVFERAGPMRVTLPVHGAQSAGGHESMDH